MEVPEGWWWLSIPSLLFVCCMSVALYSEGMLDSSVIGPFACCMAPSIIGLWAGQGTTTETKIEVTRGEGEWSNNRSYIPQPKTQPKKKSYSGICNQQKRNHSKCGKPTNSRCPRCSRYACGSCRGSRTYNGRKVCEACNRSMSGD